MSQHDLSQLNASASSAGAVMQVEHPGTGEPIPDWTITLVGQDSPEYQAKVKQQARRRLSQSAAKGRLKIDVDEVMDDSLDLLVVATKSWSGVTENGKALECTPDAVRDVYARSPWLREQVNAFISNRANFLGNS